MNWFSGIMMFFPVVSHIGASLFFAKPRFNKLVTALIWLFYGALFMVLPVDRPTLNFFTSFGVHLVLFFVTTSGRWQEKGFLFLSYACIYTCFATCLNILEFSVANTALRLILSFFAMALMQVLLYAVLLPAYRKVIPFIRTGWMKFYLIVLGFFALVVAQSIFPARAPMTVKEICVFLLTILTFCVTYTAVFLSMKNMVELLRVKQKQIHAELLQTQVDLQAKEAELVRQNRHDMRHHYQIMLSYVRENEMEKLTDYLKRQTERIEAITTGRFCENETANNIIRVFYQKAASQNISMQVRAAVKPELSANAPDLVAIIANVLENAIHGAAESGSKQPVICVNICHKDQRLVIDCENTCSTRLDFEEMPENLRGIGIHSITTTAEKYNGLCRFAAKDGSFHALVIVDE